ncbi:hypothetical protein PHOSAC3_90044 [Mesotoga infera]|nr:hypothetical protein PHOSAC3_90044 [Mesotoga infera]
MHYQFFGSYYLIRKGVLLNETKTFVGVLTYSNVCSPGTGYEGNHGYRRRRTW